MILTKSEIIRETLRGYDFKDKAVKKVLKVYRAMPEVEFILMAKKELNFNLDPIRKNQYIVT